jgi:hypothetical protein
LRHADNSDRATGLASLAARLSWSDVKESVLAEAVRSARLIADRKRRSQALAVVASQYPTDRQADFLEESGWSEPVPPPALYEPPLDRNHWGRFVMLRKGLRQAITYLPANAYLSWPDTAWCAFFKEVRSPAELEVTPELLLLSLRDAANCDPVGMPLWRGWVLNRLPGSALLTNLLALLDRGP